MVNVNMKKRVSYPIKFFSLIFLSFLLLFLGVAGGFLFQKLKAEKKILKAKERQNIEILRRIANDDVKSVALDLFFLSVHPVLHQMIDNTIPVAPQKLADDFLAFCSNSGRYDQIRFLDKTGMERIRINFNQGQPYIVPEDKLQNKVKRYYFADTFAMEPGRIFVSPFDLNIEQGKIEQPLKPMIRFGTPVVNLTGQKQGIVLLNYLGTKLILKLKEELPDSMDSFMLLNTEGYWLKGESAEDEWGFMYEDRKDLTLAKRHPEAWKEISTQDEGQFVSDQGLYTFTTVWPLGKSMLSSSGSSKAFQASTAALSGKKYYWKIVSQITTEKIKGLKSAIFLSWLPYLGIVFIFILLASFVFAMALENRKQVLKERIERERLQGVLEMAGAVCHELNQPLMGVSGYSELLLLDTLKDTHQYETIRKIKGQVDRMGIITKKLMHVTQYKTKTYLKGHIVDIDAASDE